MSTLIEALYIYDDQRKCILEHVYQSRPPPPKQLHLQFQAHPFPQPALLYLSDLSPPTTVASIYHSNVLFLCPSSIDQNALAIFEFLHRVIDVFEDFLGAPLLAQKIESNYDIVAQLLGEMCDGGMINNTESNVLRENVEVAGLIGKLLTQVGLPSSSPALGSSNQLATALKSGSQLNSGPAIPWRRANVRHTSNELYVDMVEKISVILAPSGRPISAIVSGSIAFTANVSGVPELLLTLSAPGGSSSSTSSSISRLMQSPVFHPCVRLTRWKDHPGELSFVPPDGRFVLAGYEVDLLPSHADADQPPSRGEKLFLPAHLDLQTGLGEKGLGFEVRLTFDTNFPGPRTTAKSASGPGRSGTSTPSLSFGGNKSGNSNSPVLEAVVVAVPLPESVRSVTDLRPSRGEAHFQQVGRVVEWRVPTKDGSSVKGTAVLSGMLVGSVADFADDDEQEEGEEGEHHSNNTNRSTTAASDSLLGYYDADSASVSKSSKFAPSRNTSSIITPTTATSTATTTRRQRSQAQALLMPRSATLSFKVRGWLPSGIKVDALVLDPRRSKGIGDNLKPFKGVKYISVSRKGVERRA